MTRVWRDGPGPLEDVEAVGSLPDKRRGERHLEFIDRAALELGHRDATPDDRDRYTPDTVRLARRVLNTPSVKDRIDAIMRGELDHVKPGAREPGSEG